MPNECASSGETIVFVTETDKKIYMVTNPDKVKLNIARKYLCRAR